MESQLYIDRIFFSFILLIVLILLLLMSICLWIITRRLNFPILNILNKILHPLRSQLAQLTLIHVFFILLGSHIHQTVPTLILLTHPLIETLELHLLLAGYATQVFDLISTQLFKQCVNFIELWWAISVDQDE